MNKFTIQQLQQMHVGEELKPMSDAMYLKILQESGPNFSENICEGQSLETSNGIQLTPLYEEMKQRAGVTDRIEDTNVPVNVPVNDTIKLSQLTERQKKIYHIINNDTINDTINVPINVPVNVQVNVQVNIPNLAALFNVSEKTVRRDLYVLRDKNLIQYEGSDETGHWEVIDAK